jgi:K+ transporter
MNSHRLAGDHLGFSLTRQAVLLGQSKKLKISYGGRYPLAAGAFCYVVMVTWSDGRKLVAKRLRSATRPLDRRCRFPSR